MFTRSTSLFHMLHKSFFTICFPSLLLLSTTRIAPVTHLTQLLSLWLLALLAATPTEKIQWLLPSDTQKISLSYGMSLKNVLRSTLKATLLAPKMKKKKFHIIAKSHLLTATIPAYPRITKTIIALKLSLATKTCLSILSRPGKSMVTVA